MTALAKVRTCELLKTAFGGKRITEFAVPSECRSAILWKGAKSRTLQTLRAIRILTYVDLVEREVAGEAQVGDVNSLEKIVENVCYFPPRVYVFGAHDQFIIQSIAPLELPSRRQLPA